jgi:aspartyl-tRNA(Asn)/glutamyl-tRNA(Gln) amidotransferase subunit A
MPLDLTAAVSDIQLRRSTAVDALALSQAAADLPVNRHTFIRRFAGTQAVAAGIDAQAVAGLPLPPLAGLAVSVKDLFDVAGHPTTGGSRALAEAQPATRDCTAVSRLRAAGAALVGHTNLTEFAFSGVGINPHHGTPLNAAAALDAPARIPGGSTSGGATSVASGAAWAALGSDTGGSIRIPAALQGLVGFKNTARLTPLDGAIPLSTSLDTASAITRSVRDAVLLHEILAARRVMLAHRPVAALTLAVPGGAFLEGLDAAVASAFERSLATLRRAGARLHEIALPEVGELAAINAAGGLPAAESWAWHRSLLATREADYDPRVALRIRRGERMSAADYIALLNARADWIARMTPRLAPFDALLSPTVPMLAPPVADLAGDDAFFATNARLLRNPSVVNMLDGCALSLPCQRAGEMPVGLMVWSSALRDDTVLDASLAIERALSDAEAA